jgi:excisionase family DNA binding protein
MKPATAAAMAACLEQLAAALREETQEKPQAERVKLTAAARLCGIPASTLRELCLRREITATRTGRTWRVRLSDVEAYQQRNEVRARGSLREVATSTT